MTLVYMVVGQALKVQKRISIKLDAGSLSDAAFKLIPGSLHELVTLLRRA